MARPGHRRVGPCTNAHVNVALGLAAEGARPWTGHLGWPVQGCTCDRGCL